MFRIYRCAAAAGAVLMLGLAACGSADTANRSSTATEAARATATATATAAAPSTTSPLAGAQRRTKETGPEPGFDQVTFSNPTNVDNAWFPLKPGTQYIYEGQTIEDGEKIAHRVVFTVTDLTKVVAGVRTVVAWDRDYSAGELEESELAFFAQADDGNVWHFGQYPEGYEDGKIVETPAWIHGIKGAQAGITIKAYPTPGTPSYSQGWGPGVGWSDRARVYKTGQRTCVRAGCYANVLVTDEFSLDEPGAHQLKYYAPGVGNVRVGWAGNDPTKETLELIKVVHLSPTALADVRQDVLKQEQRAYKMSKAVYGTTAPMQRPGQ